MFFIIFSLLQSLLFSLSLIYSCQQYFISLAAPEPSPTEMSLFRDIRNDCRATPTIETPSRGESPFRTPQLQIESILPLFLLSPHFLCCCSFTFGWLGNYKIVFSFCSSWLFLFCLFSIHYFLHGCFLFERCCYYSVFCCVVVRC